MNFSMHMQDVILTINLVSGDKKDEDNPGNDNSEQSEAI